MTRTRIGFPLLAVILALTAGCRSDVTAERAADPNAASAADARPAPDPKAAPTTPVTSGDPTIASGAEGAAPTTPPVPAYREVTLPAGTRLTVRLDSGVSSNNSRIEDRVDGALTAPVRVGQTVVVPAGSQVRGDVVAAEPSGKVKGRARVALRFRTLSVGESSYPIVAQVSRMAPATKRQDAEKIAMPAVGGAIVGALIGGKEGAAIGAAAGGGAGTAVVLATPGKEVSIPRGSVLTLRLQEPVTVRVKT
jgi:hypothetical protein